MLFHIVYKIQKGNRNAAQERFKKTGALPKDGVNMNGRWHSVDGNKGFIIADSSNLDSVGRWIQEWSDVLDFEITPVLTDEQVSKVIT